MPKKLKIAMISSECVPFAKTGGLADVVGALPGALTEFGHEVVVILPKYGFIDSKKHNIRPFLRSLGVWMGDSLEWCAVDSAPMSGNVTAYFVEYDRYFKRNGLYHDPDFNDYLDNPRRFAFLSRAGLQLLKDIGFQPDIVHVHDWQTALAAAYLKIWHWDDPELGHAASMLTIHNVGYQGVYPAEHFSYTGLQRGNFTSDKFEDHGNMNYLKGGIYYADIVNTVSPTYAQETRTPELAYGMAPYLNNKGNRYFGIINGVDYTEWDPATDKNIPLNYSSTDLSGKSICKKELQKRFNLVVDENTPIIGVVSRFVEQKGLDLLANAIEAIIANMQVQLVILGSGDKELEYYFGGLPDRFPGLIGSFIGYNNELAHWIEAGSDFFIMPSRYEPCGLNQIYSLKYGTLPIVRATGGLDDTVQQYDEISGTGTGFKFWEPSTSAVYYAVGWAVSTYYDRKMHFNHMIHQAMEQNFSWKSSAQAYEAAYYRAIEIKSTL